MTSSVSAASSASSMLSSLTQLLKVPSFISTTLVAESQQLEDIHMSEHATLEAVKAVAKITCQTMRVLDSPTATLKQKVAKAELLLRKKTDLNLHERHDLGRLFDELTGLISSREAIQKVQYVAIESLKEVVESVCQANRLFRADTQRLMRQKETLKGRMGRARCEDQKVVLGNGAGCSTSTNTKRKELGYRLYTILKTLEKRSGIQHLKWQAEKEIVALVKKTADQASRDEVETTFLKHTESCFKGRLQKFSGAGRSALDAPASSFQEDFKRLAFTDTTDEEVVSPSDLPSAPSSMSMSRSRCEALSLPEQISRLCQRVEESAHVVEKPSGAEKQEWMKQMERGFSILSARAYGVGLFDEQSMEYLIQTGGMSEAQSFILRNAPLSNRLLLNYMRLRGEFSSYDPDNTLLMEIQSLFIGPIVFRRLVTDYFAKASEILSPFVQKVSRQIEEALVEKVWQKRKTHFHGQESGHRNEFSVDISRPIHEILEKFREGAPLIYPAIYGSEGEIVSFSHESFFCDNELRLAQALNSGYFYRNYEFIHERSAVRIIYFFQLLEHEKIAGSSVWSLYETLRPVEKKEVEGDAVLLKILPLQDMSKAKRHTSEDSVDVAILKLKKESNRSTLRALRREAKQHLEADIHFQRAVATLKTMQKLIVETAHQVGLKVTGERWFPEAVELNADVLESPLLRTHYRPTLVVFEDSRFSLPRKSL